MSEGRPEPTGRWSARVLMILSILLLAGAGALVWLHVSGRLQPLLAASPSIAVELPASVATGEAAPSPAAGEAESPPVAVAELAPAPEAPAAAAPEPPASSAAAPAPGAEAPMASEATEPAPPAPAAPPPTPEQAPDQQAVAEPEPPTPVEPEPPSPTAQETAAAAAAQQAAAAPPATTSPETPAADADATGEAVEPAAVPSAAAELAAQASDAPPPPAPPVPELPAEPAAQGTQAPADQPAAAEDAGAAADDAAAEDAETPAENPQVAAATVPPGVIPTWQRLARPFPPDETRPRIAVVVAGLGLSEAATTAAIQQLPAEITLSFSPYSNRVEEWVAMARAAGHEVLIDLPMEPASFPRDDPGPQALLTSLGEQTNAERLAWTLSRTEGFLGVATFMGSRFTTSAEHMRPILAELGQRGLLILDSRSAADSLTASLAMEAGVAHAINDRFLDNEASRVAIDGRLQQIERIARTKGVAVAMGYAYPVTIERLREWVRGLAGKELTLAPISAVADRQEMR